MANTAVAYTPNPLTTVAQANWATIDRTGKTVARIGQLSAAAANSFTYALPDNNLEVQPAIYVLFAEGATGGAGTAVALLCVRGTSTLDIVNFKHVTGSATTTANEIRVQLSTGTLTIENAGTNAPSPAEVRNVYLSRLF